MTKEKKFECKKCGSKNVYGSKKCYKCGTSLVWSCPKCAKVNSIEDAKCSGCGKLHKAKSKTKIGLLFIVLFIFLLLGLVVLNKQSIVSDFSNSFRIICAIFVVLLLVNSLTYGRKHEIKYSAEEEIAESTRVRATRTLFICGVIAILLIAGVLVYFKFYMK